MIYFCSSLLNLFFFNNCLLDENHLHHWYFFRDKDNIYRFYLRLKNENSVPTGVEWITTNS
jgi:hypothetical protein